MTSCLSITMSVLENGEFIAGTKDLCDAWGNPAYQESNEYYNNELSQKIRSYNGRISAKNIDCLFFDRGHSKETR